MKDEIRNNMEMNEMANGASPIADEDLEQVSGGLYLGDGESSGSGRPKVGIKNGVGNRSGMEIAGFDANPDSYAGF